MLCVLGQPGVARSGGFEPLTLRPRALAVVAYLALVGHAVARHELARLLFSTAEEPRAALRWYLTYLRSALPGRLAQSLRATRDSVALATPTDVALFRSGAEQVCRAPDAPGAAETLALYRDDLLAGLAVTAAADFDNWLYVEQEGLRRLLRRATVAFARWALRHERAAATIGSLSRLVSVDPYFEEGHALLIDAYLASGQSDHAESTYDRYQHIMREELRAEPRHVMAQRLEPAPMAGRAGPRDDLVPLSEVTLHVLDWPGPEPAIVAIHGSASSSYVLTVLAERLAPEVRFIALDLRGHGFSDKPPSGYRLERHVQDVQELIDALGVWRPIVLGHSAGGTIATFVAARAPVGGLVLLDAMVGDRAFTENTLALLSPSATSLDRKFSSFDAYLSEFRSRNAPLSDEGERFIDRWARYELAPLPDGSYRRRALRRAVEAEWASIAEADSLGTLARVSCPTLIVRSMQPWAGNRPYFTDEIVAAQLRAASRAELFAAHLSDQTRLVRDPEPGMVAAIKQFVERNRRMLGSQPPRAHDRPFG